MRDRLGRESLGRVERPINGSCGRLRAALGTVHPLQLRSLPVRPDAIPERISSSSLPPSFALGRFAAFFSPGGTALTVPPFFRLSGGAG